jgi:flavodoxin
VKALVVYDSTFGNTEQVAKAIAAGMGPDVDVRAIKASLADPAAAIGVDLLVIGSPTNGGRPTKPVQDFIKRLPALGASTRVAAFDTRMPQRWAAIFGYAGPRIASSLQAKGGRSLTSPEPFFVDGQKGPLQDGELAKATTWGRRLIE